MYNPKFKILECDISSLTFLETQCGKVEGSGEGVLMVRWALSMSNREVMEGSVRPIESLPCLANVSGGARISTLGIALLACACWATA
jgi:hypothetical protein